ncbi:MAG: hypothetical protein K2K60_02490, partial [Clostridia bacterium]|nr:hypothetical protein [Clostridia bacterium]
DNNMDYPIKVFEIKGFSGGRIKLEIIEVFGFPNETSFRGGYDIKCNLEIISGMYSMRTNHYYSSTGALYNFYIELLKCYNDLKGVASYKLKNPENYFDLNVEFDEYGVNVSGKYQDEPVLKNILIFEFTSDQSYFKEALNDLKKIVLQFGDNRGIKK